jgi:diaminohydroxyphosphoribosylaminopyrimidine deaminase/5-amino-6-(5-phosphoribosylamino)uracil reductase
MGGDDGVPVCRGPGPELMIECLPVRDINVRQFGDDVMIEGYIDKR